MSRKPTNYERETIINFNEAEDTAAIFTYNKTWQKHLEKKLGLKPTMDNGFGGKEYEIPKERIRPPRAPIKLSAEARAKRANRIKALHQKPNLSAQTTIATRKSDKKNQKVTNTIKQYPRTMK